MKIINVRALLEKLSSKFETDTLEAKSCSFEISESVYESICAFSNTKGGHILLGINPSTLKPEGVTFDIQQKKDEITNKCLEIYNQRVFVHIIHDSVDSKDVVVINVEESKDKPIYIKKDGQPKGAFRRVNGINKKCCWDDIKDFELHKRITEFDRESIDQAMINDIDDESIFFYKKERESVDQNASELKYTDKINFLRALGCMDSSNKINVCGLLCFGTDQAINYYFPSSHADIIISESDDWAPNIYNWSSLYSTHKSLLKQWNDLIVEMKDRLPSTTRIDKNFQRRTMPILPDIVIRECITNMIIHRDYRVSRPSQIIKYRKYIDVSNSGYSLKPIDQMAHSGSVQRNPLIVNIFRNINYVEKTGIGMNTIYTALKGDHFEKPVIDSNEESNIFRIRLKFYQSISESAQKFIDNIRDSLTISLTNHDISALIHVLEYKRITNVAYREVNYVDSLTASKGLKKLVDYGLLIKHGNSSKTTEYLASEIFNKLR